MPLNDSIDPTKERLEENPAVDSDIVRQALKMREELERLGLWEDSGSRVRNPFETQPEMYSDGFSKNRFITQSD